MKWLPGQLVPEKLSSFFKRYRFVFLVIAVGVILLLLPEGKSRAAPNISQGVTGREEDFSVAALEDDLEKILSRIQGAGEVSVMLTVRTGVERVLATDRETYSADAEEECREEVVVISTDSGDEVVLVGQNYPTFQGALVVCPGGDDPEIQLKLIRALSALTGLGSGRITVCKGA